MVSRQELAALREQYPDLPWPVRQGGVIDPARARPAARATCPAGWLRRFAARFAVARKAVRAMTLTAR